MRVLFQSRIDLFDRRGGDTVQMERTAQELGDLGVDVDIDCSPKKDLSAYDLVHLFNIDWPANVYLCAKNARDHSKPLVFSPIHHPFEEIERYEREYRFGLRRIINTIFRKREQREKFKDFCRALADPKKIPSTIIEFKRGIFKEQQELLELADAVLVQTDAEVDDIREDFGWSTKGKIMDLYTGGERKKPGFKRQSQSLALGNSLPALLTAPVYKVVNGVDRRFAEAKPDWFKKNYGWENFVLCVGRIEPRKNQLSVIESVSNVKWKMENVKLIFLGKISWRHPEYALRFNNMVRKYDWIRHIERIPYEKMGAAYAAAKVHVSASWFETTGLVSLEAGLAGCNVVATGERAREYLGDFAFYCDPGDLDSITKAISKASETAVNPEFKQHILNNFTWDKTAEQTLAVYKTILNN